MSDIRQQLQETLGTSYTLERELAGGGMSRVFVATDPALNRRVVIKVLAPEMAEKLSAERFAREIRLAAALQDPHIVPVHSAGESGGLPFYTMPFVEGESLRARLLRGPVPFSEAVGILRDVALALEYAHARGVVHRDIKPENVLLAGRSAVVADFGIAKAVSAARTQSPGAPSGTLTSIGQSLGTPAYMAPEQVAADPIDHRADLYSWGVVAYELLAGRHPFADKSSAAQLMAAQVTEVPRPISEVKPGLPPPVAALVKKCLEKQPGSRPHSAGEIVEALDAIHSPSAPLAVPARRRTGPTLAVIAVALVSLGVGAVLFARRNASGASSAPTGSGAATNARSIAVLPFENLGDSADAYFADGITDAVRGKLTALDGVTVIARASSVQYRKTAKLPRDVAKDLGVRYLLTGTVRFATTGRVKRVQVSPELVEISDDGQPQSRWQQPFDAEVSDVFHVQGDIASKVAEAMRVALAGAAQTTLAKAPTTNPAAYDAYLRGEAAWEGGAKNDPLSLRRAIGFYEQAVARDSTMADAWGALSRARSLLYSNSSPTTELAESALAAARRAVALERDGAVAHRAMGAYYQSVTLDHVAALKEFELALRAAPSSAMILNDMAAAKSDVGRLEEAQRDREAAIQLDPRNGRLWIQQSQTLLRLRRTADARAASERAVAVTPTSMGAILSRVVAEVSAGELARARQAIVDASRDAPLSRILSYVTTYWDMGWVLDGASEQQVLALGPEEFDDDRATWALVRAQQYHWRGDTALARAWGDSANREGARQLRDRPGDAQMHVLRGLALAYAGKAREGMAESARGLELGAPDTLATRSINYAYYTYISARTALVAGDREKAIELLGEAMRLRYFVTPAWLRIDPTWKSLRGDPRFEKLSTEP